MIDVQDNVLRFFAIDHVLVYFVTIATTGAIFNSPKTVWRPGSVRTRDRGPTSKGRGREGGKRDRMGGEKREGRGGEKRHRKEGRKGEVEGRGGSEGEEGGRCPP